jgi:hypothetical protein
MIEASISRGSRTYTASMSVTVTTVPLDGVEIAGDYELTALILSSNPGGGTWSGFEGSRFTADLVLSGGGASGISGYFLNLVLTAPEPAPGLIRDTSLIVAVGAARSQFDGYGGEQLTLKSNEGDPRGPFAMNLWVAAKSSDFIRGTFGCCGQVGGHFEIRRK